MTFEYLVMGAGIIFILILVLIFLYNPSEKGISRKEKKRLAEEALKQKNWQEVAGRLEKQVQSLRNEIAFLQKKEVTKDKEAALEKTKTERLEEKLKQAQEWHDKEQQEVDRKTIEFRKLKEFLLQIQSQYSSEHSETLRLQQDITALKNQFDSVNHARRVTEGDNAQLKARIENYLSEMSQLKKENAQLQKKEDDKSWIAKTEYERVVNLLKETQRDLERKNS